MSQAAIDKHKPPIQGTEVLIAGPREFKNALISFYLEKEGYHNCRVGKSLEDIHVAETSNQASRLVLWDVHRLARSQLLEALDALDLRPETHLALFDVDPQLRIEKIALEKGVKGFFYQNDPLERFLSGLEFIGKGELWVSRRILERCIMENLGQQDEEPASQDSDLTAREEEVMALIAKGHSNSEIAEQLFISLHTVKAHVYKAFRKINVNNRTQAARWANQNLKTK